MSLKPSPCDSRPPGRAGPSLCALTGTACSLGRGSSSARGAARARPPAARWGGPAAAAGRLTSWRPGWAAPKRGGEWRLRPSGGRPHREAQRTARRRGTRGRSVASWGHLCPPACGCPAPTHSAGLQCAACGGSSGPAGATAHTVSLPSALSPPWGAVPPPHPVCPVRLFGTLCDGGGQHPRGHQVGSPRVVSFGSCTRHVGCSGY